MPVESMPFSAFSSLSRSRRASSEGIMRQMMTIRVWWIKFKHDYCMIKIVALRQITLFGCKHSSLSTREYQSNPNKRTERQQKQITSAQTFEFLQPFLLNQLVVQSFRHVPQRHIAIRNTAASGGTYMLLRCINTLPRYLLNRFWLMFSLFQLFELAAAVF
jgi:hypothetical protein